MILNEIGSPVGFMFKEILYNSQKMKSDDYPGSIFFFNKVYCGECNFRVDFERENFFISILIIDYLQESFKVDPSIVMECINDILQQEEQYKDYEILVMSDWEVDNYDTAFKNDKFNQMIMSEVVQG